MVHAQYLKLQQSVVWLTSRTQVYREEPHSDTGKV